MLECILEMVFEVLLDLVFDGVLAPIKKGTDEESVTGQGTI